MSLLNEALRKKHREEQMPPLARTQPQQAPKSSAMTRKLMAGTAALMLLIVALAGWFWWLEPKQTVVSNQALTTNGLATVPTSDDMSVPEPPRQAPPESVLGVKAPSVLALSALPATKPNSAAHPSPGKAEESHGQKVNEKGRPLAAVSSVPAPGPSRPTVPTPLKLVDSASNTAKEDPVMPSESPPDRPAARHRASGYTPSSSSSTKAHRQDVSENPNPAERLYHKARQYHQQRRYEQAIAMYEKLLQLRPDHLEAQFNLASACIAAADFAKAKPLLDNLRRQQPQNGDILLNLAIATIGQGRAANALALLDEAEQLNPDADYDICFHRGVAHRRLKQFEKALYWYRQAIAIRPHQHQLLFNMAVAYDSLQNYAPAVRCYYNYLKKAKDIEPAERKQIEQRIRHLKAHLANSSINRAQP